MIVSKYETSLRNNFPNIKISFFNFWKDLKSWANFINNTTEFFLLLLPVIPFKYNEYIGSYRLLFAKKKPNFSLNLIYLHSNLPVWVISFSWWIFVSSSNFLSKPREENSIENKKIHPQKWFSIHVTSNSKAY